MTDTKEVISDVAKVVVALLPLTTKLIIEGKEIVATFKADMTIEEMTASLEKSKSETWPKLGFGVE